MVAQLSWTDFFPYDKIRPLQKEMIEGASEFLRSGGHYVTEAANGVGKTVAALASVLPIARDLGLKIVYLCRTHEQMDQVIAEAKRISKKTPISAVSVRGRREMCIHELLLKHAKDARTAAEVCWQLRKNRKCKYFKALGTPFAESLIKEMGGQPVAAPEIIAKCKPLEVCPAEINRKLLASVDIVAMSYVYMLDPFIRQSFLPYLDTPLNNILLVMDEAHNIPSAAIEASSAKMSTYSIMQAEREATQYNELEVAEFMEGLLSAVQSILDEIPNSKEEMAVAYNSLNKEFRRCYGQDLNDASIAFVLNTAESIKEQMEAEEKPAISFVNSVGQFLENWQDNAKRPEFTTLAVSAKRKRDQIYGHLELLSLDPRITMDPILRQTFGSLSMSGTMSPMDAYVQLLNLGARRHNEIQLPSPYSSKNVISFVTPGLTTKYDRRGPRMYRAMVKAISAISRATPKNIGVFTTSYAIQKGLLAEGLEQELLKPLFAAVSGMSSRQNDTLVANFKEESKKHGALLLGVLGGRSSEGSDFPGDFMNTVIIVGIPLAPPSPRVAASIDYLDSQFNRKGKEYGYIVPAMTRASQATGRPIRSLTDRAAIILMDERFGTSYYKRYLPSWVTQNIHMGPHNPDDYEMELNNFFYGDVLDSF